MSDRVSHAPTVDARIRSTLARLERRERALAYLTLLIRWAFYTALVAVVCLWATTIPLGLLTGSWIALSLGGAAVSTFLGRRSRVKIAKEYDDALGLKDRLSSALAIPASTPMARKLHREVREIALGVDPKKIYRFRMPREGWLVPLPLLAGFLILLLPALLQGEPRLNEELEALVNRRAGDIERVIESLKREDPKRFKDEIELLEELNAHLDKDRIKKKEALSEISDVMKELEKKLEDRTRKEIEQRELLKKLQQNEQTKELSDEVNSGNYDEAARRLKELEKELQKKLQELKKQNLDPREIRKLEEEIRKLKELHAKLLNLRNLRLNINQVAQILDFLGSFEGELGEISDFDVSDVKFVRLGDKPKKCEKCKSSDCKTCRAGGT